MDGENEHEEYEERGKIKEVSRSDGNNEERKDTLRKKKKEGGRGTGTTSGRGEHMG